MYVRHNAGGRIFVPFSQENGSTIVINSTWAPKSAYFVEIDSDGQLTSNRILATGGLLWQH